MCKSEIRHADAVLVVEIINNRNDCNRTANPCLRLSWRIPRSRFGPRNTLASRRKPCQVLRWQSCWSRLCRGEPRANTAIGFPGTVAGELGAGSGELQLVFRADFRLGLSG